MESADHKTERVKKGDEHCFPLGGKRADSVCCSSLQSIIASRRGPWEPVPRTGARQPGRASALSRSRTHSVPSLPARPIASPCGTCFSTTQTACPLGSLPKPSICLGRPGNLSSEGAGLLSCSVTSWTAVTRRRLPRRKGQCQCGWDGVLHGHWRCTVAHRSDFYPHLSRLDFLSVVTAACDKGTDPCEGLWT